MNTKSVVLTVLLSLLLVTCLLHPATAAAPLAPTAHTQAIEIPVGVKDLLCEQKAHDSCDTKKCCKCKWPKYGTCFACCLA
ncbi:hypothetical protein LINGRAHAP2_LOCUS33636 [Linum grandiflorum]